MLFITEREREREMERVREQGQLTELLRFYYSLCLSSVGDGYPLTSAASVLGLKLLTLCRVTLHYYYINET